MAQGLAHAAACIAITLAVPASAEVCVVNGTGERHLFAAESRGAARAVGWLEAGDTLCSGAAGGGVVSVFEAEDAFEGCSRLVDDGTAETLLRYADFDRCRWSSHDG